jgi:hypothetical protein
MTAFRIAGFSGLVPRLAKQLLAPGQAQVATNCNLTSGDLRPRNGPLLVDSPDITGDIVSMFRMEKDGNEQWLSWTRDVDVARSPIAGNTEKRFYYTGDGEPRVSDYDTATTGVGPYPDGCYVLGVTPPITLPTVSPSGGGGATASRAYCYTFVTQWGEESAPSPASTVTTGKVDDTWALSGLDTAPPSTGTVSAATRDTPSSGYVTVTLNSVFGLRAYEEITFASVAGMTDLNATFPIVSVSGSDVVVALATVQTYTSGGSWTRAAPHNTSGMTKRIYRSVDSASATEYQYVATITAATSTYNDTTLDANLGEVLPSATWLMPPANMKGITIMANGIACGFFGNEICFSEPFKPYAWPSAYRQTYDQDIVAIGVTGTTLVGMTEGSPFTITGVDPVTMGGGMQSLGVAWPCMAKGSVACFPFGVAYAAPQGLAIIGTTSDIVTKDLFTLKEWSELQPTTFIASTADNRYYCAYTVDGSSLMFVIDKSEAASFIKVNKSATDIWTDPATGKLYIALEKKIYEWEGDPGTKLNYEWKSKRFVMAPPLNFGACKIDADFEQTEAETAGVSASYDAIVASNVAFITDGTMNDALSDSYLGEYEIGGDAMQAIPALSIDALQFQLYADGDLKYTKHVTTPRAFRLPGGYKTDNLEVTLSGNVKVTGVVLAETMDGLKGA